jgi:hypothetical protein
MTLRVLVASLAVFASCKNSATQPEPAPTTVSAQPATASPAAADPAAAAPIDAPSAPIPGTVDTSAGSGSGLVAKPVIHGDKWKSDEEGGKNFTAFKETWVYVDGVPKAAMLFAELPVELPVAWKDDVEDIDFKPGDPPPHQKKIQVLRYRLSDYFNLIGIDVSKIKMVYLHGTGYVAIPGPQFRKFGYGITFDFTGNDFTKTRFYWPTNMTTNTAYDRYAVVSVFIDKPLLKLDVHNNPFIDGVEVDGVPYHGTPERGGFRVYVDNKLAMVVKRNELGAVGRITSERWDLMKLLEAHGVKVAPVAGDLVVAQDAVVQKRDRLDAAYVKDLEVGVNAQASGTLMLGKDNLPATALHLYTKGHVPPVLPLPELQHDVPVAKLGVRSGAKNN